MSRRRPDFPLDRVPCVVIVLGVEELRPRVYSRSANPSERARVFDWVRSRDDLDRLLRQAFGEPEPEREREDEGELADDEEAEDDYALLFESYAEFPCLSLRDLRPVRVAWLEEVGVEVEGGRVVGWDVPFDVEAEVGDATFRPNATWPPSLEELEERAG